MYSVLLYRLWSKYLMCICMCVYIYIHIVNIYATNKRILIITTFSDQHTMQVKTGFDATAHRS